MTSVPFTVACSLLAVDPKTLRQWLKRASLSLHPSLTDARVKCLTCEQVHLLANLHGRVLPPEPSATSQMAPVSLDVPSSLERLTQLEAQVTSLQAQIAALALQLLGEREQRTQQRLLTLEAFLTSTAQAPRSSLSLSPKPETLPSVLHPTQKRARLIPLIEYSAGGSYVLIEPSEGELHITADSPEWFTWLASLSSFRFVGKSGRLSARRGPAPRSHHSWYAQRTIHQQSYCKYIGVSQNITTTLLEQIAATFQSYMP